ncbi:MAG: glycosyl hydrolase [Flavobacteriaceae bacterium]|nr:glycosyl hydrolase [Flavobacteriaceae bacterium]
MKKLAYLLAVMLVFPLANHAQRKTRKKKAQSVATLPDSIFNNLKFRNIGPFRGGRSVAVTGVVSQPRTYYMGATGGGVYKTTDDGITWKNISDKFFKTGTVGALAVSESNPNIVIAGMGEHAARGVMTSMGDGVYKSTDAGKTWTHIGLDKTRHISDVLIHPSNPDIIFVSAQGAQYGPSQERGVYRSSDGGLNWERVLFVNDNTGASGLTMDMKNPLILYAAMWQHRRYPYTIESGGENSGLYKSTDGGTTWKKLTEGLPKAFGKAGISVSRANPDRVFAVIEAEGKKSGVYRSDDAGKKWKQVNADRINVTRSWYYMEIFADPQNENIVYVLNAPAMRSIDGGKTFTRMPTPHGDNHDLWIHPHNNKILINANDGGANVSNNWGKSWSTQQNQATSQFYRVITDNLVPYNVYGGQQDNSAITIASRTNGQGITWKDWYSVAGCESAYLAFDPDDPEVVYGGCYQGIIERWVKSSNEGKEIMAYPQLGLGVLPKDQKYRFNWNAPIISDPFDRKTIYHAANVIFKTQDGGSSWEIISPDLTRNDPTKHGVGGSPFTNEGAGGENYNTIMYLTASPHEQGVLWAGTDDGLVHLSKNSGQSWENRTPNNLPEGIINSIEVSPHDAATAYITVMRYKFLDLKPYIFKTSDYGKTWVSITSGLTDPHTFVRVVREDKKRKGLLYAGTETGLYISWNDGAHWQPFQRNLPPVPINDLTIQDNDLVLATAGRSFWILDDLTPIQNAQATGLSLFSPKDSYLIFGSSTERQISGLGQNPKPGVLVDYYLPKNADSLKVALEVLENDKVIRTYTNKAPKGFKTWPGGPGKPAVLPTKKGFNRFNWDFRRESLPGIDKVFVFGSYNGSRVGPGTYTLKLSVDDQSVASNVTVLANPTINATAEDYEEQQAILAQIEGSIKAIHVAVSSMRSAKKQLKNYAQLLEDNEKAKELLSKGEELLKRIDTWERKLIQPDQKTFQDVINYQNKLNAHFMHLKNFAGSANPKVTQGTKERLKDLLNEWKSFQSERDAIVNVEMAAYNTMYKELGLPAVIMD